MEGIAVEHAPLDAQDVTGAQNASRTQRGGAQILTWSAATDGAARHTPVVKPRLMQAPA
jgi:hypothetical protein